MAKSRYHFLLEGANNSELTRASMLHLYVEVRVTESNAIPTKQPFGTMLAPSKGASGLRVPPLLAYWRATLVRRVRWRVGTRDPVLHPAQVHLFCSYSLAQPQGCTSWLTGAGSRVNDVSIWCQMAP